MNALRQTVIQFLYDNQNILRRNPEIPLSIRIQNLIVDYVSLDIQAKLQGQVQELSKAVWYAGERGDHVP